MWHKTEEKALYREDNVTLLKWVGELHVQILKYSHYAPAEDCKKNVKWNTLFQDVGTV